MTSCRLLTPSWEHDAAVVSQGKMGIQDMTHSADTTTYLPQLPLLFPSFLEMNINNLEGSHQLSTWGFTLPKFSVTISEQISAHSSTHQSSLARLLCWGTVFLFSSSTYNPLHSHSCNKFPNKSSRAIYISFPKNIPQSQKAHATKSLSSRSSCKQTSCCMLLT